MPRTEEDWLAEAEVEHLEGMDQDELAQLYRAQIASTSMDALKNTLTAQLDGILLADRRRRTSQHSLGLSSRAHLRSLAGEGTYRMRRIYYGEG
ncbi:hypothetical protein JCM9279_005493 [Rhodotorula babjevae]